jgi:hypothetical protein
MNQPKRLHQMSSRISRIKDALYETMAVSEVREFLIQMGMIFRRMKKEACTLIVFAFEKQHLSY